MSSKKPNASDKLSKKRNKSAAAVMKAKEKKADKATEKLGQINEDAEHVVEKSRKTLREQVIETEKITLYETFIEGQVSVHILGSCNQIKSDDGTIVDNGPEYKERMWNTRPLDPTGLSDLFNATASGRLIYSQMQENALIVGVSASLIPGLNLAKYQSNSFPRAKFIADAEGQIYTINGHHRIALDKKVHKPLLDQKKIYEKALAGFETPSDHDTPEIIEARANLATLNGVLYECGFWAAIIINLDLIIQHLQAEEIKAYFSRNTVRFHLPDTPHDFLCMLLKSVRGMSRDIGYDYLENQLQRSDTALQGQLRRVLKTPDLLFLFADFYSIPMFTSSKLLTFNSLYKWRYIVPCWLSVFLAFGRDSYQYLALPHGQKVDSILDINKLDSSTTGYVFGFLDTAFHTIIDSAYKTHLAAAFIAFGNPEKKGGVTDNWAESFKDYRSEVLKKLNILSQEPGRPKAHRGCLGLLIERVKYILDEAYKVFPNICQLGSPLPLASDSFLHDIAHSLFDNEDGFFEFLSLFEPTIAIRYGYKKKTTAPVELKDIFLPFATIPSGGISADEDWIKLDTVPIFDSALSQIWAATFGARGTGISAIKTMNTNRQHLRFPGVKIADIKTIPEDKRSAIVKIDMDHQTILGLAECLNTWVHTQRMYEDSLDEANLTPEQIGYLEGDTKKWGCTLAPSSAAIPRVVDFDFKKAYALDKVHKEEILRCIGILECSRFPWSAQYSSGTHQHLLGIANSVMEIERSQAAIYCHYLGENTIWELYAKVLGSVLQFSPHFVPWHGITPENREEAEDQMILDSTAQQEDIGPIVGAGMAEVTSSINRRYQIGSQKLIKIVHGMACYEHEGERFISRNVNSALETLLLNLAEECVHQAFSFEQNEYTPLEPLAIEQKQTLLQDRLGVTNPPPDVSIMSVAQRLAFYGQSGALVAYDHLVAKSHAVQVNKKDIQKADIKAEQLIKKKSAAKQPKASPVPPPPSQPVPPPPSQPVPPPPSQPGLRPRRLRKDRPSTMALSPVAADSLDQPDPPTSLTSKPKRARAASSSGATKSPVSKKSKHQEAPSQGEGNNSEEPDVQSEANDIDASAATSLLDIKMSGDSDSNDDDDDTSLPQIPSPTKSLSEQE